MKSRAGFFFVAHMSEVLKNSYLRFAGHAHPDAANETGIFYLHWVVPPPSNSGK